MWHTNEDEFVYVLEGEAGALRCAPDGRNSC